MKLKIAAIAAGSGISCFLLSFWLTNAIFVNFLSGLAGNLIVLAIGIMLVNQYLESDARKAAVTALLVMSDQHISAYHNRWLSLCWAQFGRERFGELANEYVKAAGNPEALSIDTRKALYSIYKNSQDVQNLLKTLDDSLTELSRMAGWSLDPDVLTACIKARTAISKLQGVALDDSQHAIDEITEHSLDVDIHTGDVRRTLMKLAGVAHDSPKSAI